MCEVGDINYRLHVIYYKSISSNIHELEFHSEISLALFISF